MPHWVVRIEEPGRQSIRLLLDSPLEVGRDCAGLLLTDQQISRRHLELRPADDGVTVTDLGSSNGTFRAGSRIDSTARLAVGDSVQIGSVIITVDTAAGGSQAQPPPAPAVDGRATTIGDLIDVLENDPVDLPAEHHHGTITIVFSDIEGSTDAATAVGDTVWMERLRGHNTIVQTAAAAHGGSVVKHEGDGFMLTFPSARRAVQAAIDMQAGIAAAAERLGDMRIRVGMHTGEVIMEDNDIFGVHVIIAARVANQAAGGEILVSALTKAILETRGDVGFEGGRIVELKGLAGEQEVFPVTQA